METQGSEPPLAANQSSRPGGEKRAVSLPRFYPRPIGRPSLLSSPSLASGLAEILAWEEILTGRALHL